MQRTFINHDHFPGLDNFENRSPIIGIEEPSLEECFKDDYSECEDVGFAAYLGERFLIAKVTVQDLFFRKNFKFTE